MVGPEFRGQGLGMDPASLLTSLITATVGRAQMMAAAKLQKIGARDPDDVRTLITAAQKNFGSLANVAAGVGTRLNVRA
jgi:hypothetical protein